MLPSELIDLIGHDGSEIIYPGVDDPHGRKGFSLEEIQDVLIQLLYHPIEFHKITQFINPHGIIETVDHSKRINYYLKQKSGVLLCNSISHALAWDHQNQILYNPNGLTQSIDELDYNVFIGLF